MNSSRPEPVLVVGEALVDLIRRPGEPEVARVGGSPLNVAVGLCRLDVPALLHTSFGGDEHGAMIAGHLAGNDVQLVLGPAPGRRTSTAVATIADDGSATYEFTLDGVLEPAPAGPARLVHTGSIAAVLEPGATTVDQVLDAQRATATISYDPNARPQLMGEHDQARTRVEGLVARADVVKVSSEDLAWLHPDLDPDQVARTWAGLGPALVVVTHGEMGAYAVGAAAEVRIPAPATRLVDTIGAGDSFMAGLLAALSDADLLGRHREDRLRTLDETALCALLTFAAECAAITVSRPGADPPRREDLCGRDGLCSLRPWRSTR